MLTTDYFLLVINTFFPCNHILQDKVLDLYKTLKREKNTAQYYTCLQNTGKMYKRQRSTGKMKPRISHTYTQVVGFFFFK